MDTEDKIVFRIGKDGLIYAIRDGEVIGWVETQEGKPQGKNDNAVQNSVGVIVVKDGKILSATRNNDFGYGLLCGPGGHIEAGETPEQAAVRETEEEFGISPKELIPLGCGPVEPDNGLKPYIFLCTDYDGEPECLDLEMSDPQFWTMEELDELSDSLFRPFADSLEIMKTCLDTALFFGNDGCEIYMDSHNKADGGPGSGNFGHEGREGKVGGVCSIRCQSCSIQQEERKDT